MRSFWSDPYLWVHLAGAATVPIWLELCLLGLATGDPALPVWLELLLVGGIGITPILWMQLQRPFDIYCLLAIALKPERLTEDQRKLLTLFTMSRNQVLAVVVAVGLAIALVKLYFVAPITASITPFGSNRLIGLLVAAVAFLGANLFTQVPVAVLSVLFSSEATYNATLPFATDQIRQRFTLLGIPVNQILPPLMMASSETVLRTIAKQPFKPVVPPKVTQAPLNSDDLDSEAEDIWGEESAESPEVTPSEALTNASLTAVTTEPTTPDQKPDLTSLESKTEEVTTEEESVPASPAEVVIADDSITEESWLDAPVVDDPASAEPPSV